MNKAGHGQTHLTSSVCPSEFLMIQCLDSSLTVQSSVSLVMVICMCKVSSLVCNPGKVEDWQAIIRDMLAGAHFVRKKVATPFGATVFWHEVAAGRQRIQLQYKGPWRAKAGNLQAASHCEASPENPLGVLALVPAWLKGFRATAGPATPQLMAGFLRRAHTQPAHLLAQTLMPCVTAVLLVFEMASSTCCMTTSFSSSRTWAASCITTDLAVGHQA